MMADRRRDVTRTGRPLPSTERETATVMDELTIRTMRSDEFDAMRALSVAAFGGDEQIGALLDALHSSWCWDDLSFVAERGGELVAHALYSRAILDAPAQLEAVLVLGPVGVRPDVQRQGVGRRLLVESLRTLADRPEPLVFVEGNPLFYSQAGFIPAVDAGFQKPSDRVPDAAFQVFPLRPLRPALTGRLVYPDAFWRTDSVGLRES